MYLVRVHFEAGSELGYRAVAANRSKGCFRLEVGGCGCVWVWNTSIGLAGSEQGCNPVA